MVVISRLKRRSLPRDPETIGSLLLLFWFKTSPPPADDTEGAYDQFLNAKSLLDMRALVEQHPILAIPGFLDKAAEQTLMEGLPPSEVIQQRQRLRWLAQALGD